MKLVYGTHNPGKLAHMRRMLAGLPLAVEGLAEAGVRMPPVDETGRDPLENATIKAKAYYKVLGRPVFSCDSGLYIDGLPDEEQPGVHIRRNADGRELSDEEMILHFGALARRLGGRCTARYRNGVCLVVDEGHIFRYDGEDIATRPFLLVERPHARREPGYPLDSLSADPATGRYYYDQPQAPQGSIDAGFQVFFRRALAAKP